MTDQPQIETETNTDWQLPVQKENGIKQVGRVTVKDSGAIWWETGHTRIIITFSDRELLNLAGLHTKDSAAETAKQLLETLARGENIFFESKSYHKDEGETNPWTGNEKIPVLNKITQLLMENPGSKKLSKPEKTYNTNLVETPISNDEGKKLCVFQTSVPLPNGYEKRQVFVGYLNRTQINSLRILKPLSQVLEEG